MSTETPETVPAPDAPAANEGAAVASARAREVKLPLPSSLQEIVGSLIFASETPLTAAEIRECVRGVEAEEGDDAEVMGVYASCTAREINEALHGLEKELERSSLGFRLVCTAGAYRLQTSPSCGRHVRALLKLDRPSRLSRASLETLAIIAYRQPITKAEVEQIRGVAVDTIVKTLLDLQLVRLVGKSELPGHPFLYGTTPLFLEHFGLSSLGDLNGIDPTLQRSDPSARAAAYKKPEKPQEEKTELEQAAETAAAEKKPAEGKPADENVPPPLEEEPVEDDETPAPSGPAVGDDEDVFIDDTPDEFDDDDDDDDEFEDEDENEEGEEEEEEGDGDEEDA